LERFSGWKGGLILLVGVFAAGVGTHASAAEFFGHEERILKIESWVSFHQDSVTIPTVAQLEMLNKNFTDIQERLRRIEVLSACSYYNISPCPSAPPQPPIR
jgi:hypothetical protein